MIKKIVFLLVLVFLIALPVMAKATTRTDFPDYGIIYNQEKNGTQAYFTTFDGKHYGDNKGRGFVIVEMTSRSRIRVFKGFTGVLDGRAIKKFHITKDLKGIIFLVYNPPQGVLNKLTNSGRISTKNFLKLLQMGNIYAGYTGYEFQDRLRINVIDNYDEENDITHMISITNLGIPAERMEGLNSEIQAILKKIKVVFVHEVIRH